MTAQCLQCAQPYPTGEQGGHCTRCHTSFSSNTVFDRHLIRGDAPRCRTPEEMRAAGFTQRSTGYWGWDRAYDVVKIHKGTTSR